jgi:hypothetical protein
MPHLLILHPSVSGENHGLKVQHVDTLVDLLRSRGWVVRASDDLDPQLPSATLDADLLLIQMPGPAEVEAIARLRRERGLATIFEITDNFLAIADWAPGAHPLRSPVVRQTILHHARLSDALQVYAPGLARLFARVNDRVLSFDPYVPIPDEVPARPAGFVLGWGGTQSHEPDLAAIAPAVTAFCARRPDVTFAYMGAPGPVAKHFGAIDSAQLSARPFGDHAAYLEFVGGLHVGLGPLRPSPFNAARTDTRFSTYAALGVAAVLEDGPVYGVHRDRARLFSTPDELETILEDLYRSPAAVADLTARARRWVVRERGAARLADQRDHAYRSLLRQTPATDATTCPAEPATGDAEALRAARALAPSEALAAAEEIVAAHPGYEQAHLLLAGSLRRLGRHAEALEHIGRLRPSAVYADLFSELQALCARRVEPDDVARYAERIASPFRRARLEAGGSVLERSRSILQHQPYDHFALASTIKLLQARDPYAEELEALYERACLVAPEDVPPSRRPTRLAPFLPA